MKVRALLVAGCLASEATTFARADEVWGRGDDLVVGVRCAAGLPAKNILPKGCDFENGIAGWRHRETNSLSVVRGAGPHGEAALKLTKNNVGVWKVLPDGLLKTDREYVLACWIKPDARVSTKGHPGAGLGCGLTMWEPGWKKGRGIGCHGAGPDVWRRIVGRPGRLADRYGPNEFHVSLNYSHGSGLVCGLELFEALVKLDLTARAPSPIRQVKVVDETGAVAYDSGILADASCEWRKTIGVSAGHIRYTVMAIAVDGDVATVDYPRQASPRNP